MIDLADVSHDEQPMNFAVAAALALAAVTAADRLLFSTDSTVEVTLQAPLQKLFDKGTSDDKFAATGVLSYRDPASGAEVRIPDVEVSVRGHTSKRETECTFPKLKIKFRNVAARDASIFAGSDGVRIGTHCGENPGEERTVRFGRLPNEKSPLREVFVYHLLDAVGVPTMKARAVRITYADTGASGPSLVRNAMLLEGEDDAKQPLWNITVFERASGPALPVIADFDLAGMVVGRQERTGVDRKERDRDGLSGER